MKLDNHSFIQKLALQEALYDNSIDHKATPSLPEHLLISLILYCCSYLDPEVKKTQERINKNVEVWDLSQIKEMDLNDLLNRIIREADKIISLNTSITSQGNSQETKNSSSETKTGLSSPPPSPQNPVQTKQIESEESFRLQTLVDTLVELGINGTEQPRDIFLDLGMSQSEIDLFEQLELIKIQDSEAKEEQIHSSADSSFFEIGDDFENLFNDDADPKLKEAELLAKRLAVLKDLDGNPIFTKIDPKSKKLTKSFVKLAEKYNRVMHEEAQKLKARLGNLTNEDGERVLSDTDIKLFINGGHLTNEDVAKIEKENEEINRIENKKRESNLIARLTEMTDHHGQPIYTTEDIESLIKDEGIKEWVDEFEQILADNKEKYAILSKLIGPNGKEAFTKDEIERFIEEKISLKEVAKIEANNLAMHEDIALAKAKLTTRLQKLKNHEGNRIFGDQLIKDLIEKGLVGTGNISKIEREARLRALKDLHGNPIYTQEDFKFKLKKLTPDEFVELAEKQNQAQHERANKLKNRLRELKDLSDQQVISYDEIDYLINNQFLIEKDVNELEIENEKINLIDRLRRLKGADGCPAYTSQELDKLMKQGISLEEVIAVENNNKQMHQDIADVKEQLKVRLLNLKDQKESPIFDSELVDYLVDEEIIKGWNIQELEDEVKHNVEEITKDLINRLKSLTNAKNMPHLANDSDIARFIRTGRVTPENIGEIEEENQHINREKHWWTSLKRAVNAVVEDLRIS